MTEIENLPVLIDAGQIAEKVADLGARISHDYSGKDLLVVGILKGSFIFMADLVRRLSIPHKIDFMRVSSYGMGSESSGEIRVLLDLSTNVEGKHVLLVEDIVDTGITLSKVMDMLRTRNPASIGTCSLLIKPSRAKVPIKVNYPGFTIPDRFVVGYGLDCAECHRGLPFIGCLERPC